MYEDGKSSFVVLGAKSFAAESKKIWSISTASMLANTLGSEIDERARNTEKVSADKLLIVDKRMERRTSE